MPTALTFDKINDIKPNLIVRAGLFSIIILFSVLLALTYFFSYSFPLSGDGRLSKINEKQAIAEILVNETKINPFKFNLANRKITFSAQTQYSPVYSGTIVKSEYKRLYIRLDNGPRLQVKELQAFKMATITCRIAIDNLNIFQILNLTINQ